MFKDNGNGTWSMGKPDSDWISTFQFDLEFEEDWGNNRKSKSICTMENGSLSLVRKIQMSDSKKELIVQIIPDTMRALIGVHTMNFFIVSLI